MPLAVSRNGPSSYSEVQPRTPFLRPRQCNEPAGGSGGLIEGLKSVIPAKAGTQYGPQMQRNFGPCVYLMASRRNGTLYAGVTSDLLSRIHQHRTGAIPGFTTKYSVRMLVWFEPHECIEAAILREKRIKKWNRAWKLELIETDNPHWRDLAEDYGFDPLSGAGFPLARE